MTSKILGARFLLIVPVGSLRKISCRTPLTMALDAALLQLRSDSFAGLRGSQEVRGAA